MSKYGNRLTKERAEEIRVYALSHPDEGAQQIADRFGVHRNTISHLFGWATAKSGHGPEWLDGRPLPPRPPKRPSGGRPARPNPGKALPLSDLSDAQIHEIREKAAAGGRTQEEIGKDYGIGQNRVSAVVLGRVRPEAGGPISAPARRVRRPKEGGAPADAAPGVDVGRAAIFSVSDATERARDAMVRAGVPAGILIMPGGDAVVRADPFMSVDVELAISPGDVDRKLDLRIRDAAGVVLYKAIGTKTVAALEAALARFLAERKERMRAVEEKERRARAIEDGIRRVVSILGWPADKIEERVAPGGGLVGVVRSGERVDASPSDGTIRATVLPRPGTSIKLTLQPVEGGAPLEVSRQTTVVPTEPLPFSGV